jgi:hypothetical protein
MKQAMDDRSPRPNPPLAASLIVVAVVAWFFFELGAAAGGDVLWGLSFFPLAAGFVLLVAILGSVTLWSGRLALTSVLRLWPRAPSVALGAAFVLGTILPVALIGRLTPLLMRLTP